MGKQNCRCSHPDCKDERDPCEWNPEAGRAVYCSETHGPATTIVGAKGKWRLCDSCAALPHFKRFRSRRPVRRG